MVESMQDFRQTTPPPPPPKGLTQAKVLRWDKSATLDCCNCLPSCIHRTSRRDCRQGPLNCVGLMMNPSKPKSWFCLIWCELNGVW